MYAIVDSDGNVESLVKGNIEQTVGIGRKEGLVVVPTDTTPVVPPTDRDLAELASELVVNPDKVTPEYAWERVNYLQIDHARVRSMTLEEAHAKILPFMPRLLKPEVVKYPITSGIEEALHELARGNRLTRGLRRYLSNFRDRGWAEGEALSDFGREIYARMEAGDFDGYDEKQKAYYFEATTAVPGEYAPIYRRPQGMVDALLGQNYKTEKDFPFAQVEVLGLSLTPASIWALTDGRQLGLSRRPRPGGLPVWTRGSNVNTCIGASAECIKSCLVWSGRNPADPYNMMLKQARTSALMMEPDAFGKILFEACKQHLGTGRKKITPMVRLNVYSDIPWELVYPELFSELRELQFYDYTKVPDRRPPPNYDLTFSYSGRNETRMFRELARGHKAAVVFLDTDKWADADAPEYSTRRAGLPETFLGYEVIDGDISDVRPLDREIAQGPPPYIVGLKWKAPKANRSRYLYFPAGGGGPVVDPSEIRFAVPVYEVEGRLVAALVPRDEPDVGDEVAAPEGTGTIPPEELQAEGVIASNPRDRRPRKGSAVREELKRKLMR